MNWYQYIKEVKRDYDWSDDEINIAKQACIAKQATYDLDGDYDFVMSQLKEMIRESE